MADWRAEVDSRLAVVPVDAARRHAIVEELSQHLQDKYDGLCAEGRSPEEARRAVLSELEDADLPQVLARAARMGRSSGAPAREAVSWFADLGSDLRYAVRTARKTLGFSAVVILTLALGMGANAAIFSVVNVVLLRPLPYRAPEALVVMLHGGRSPVSPANFMDWRTKSRAFERMGAAEAWGPNLTEVDRPEHLAALRLTADVFPLLGIEPALGRVFGPDDDQPGREDVVVISDGLWRRRFAADPDAVGASIRLDGKAYTVIGVMPPTFMFAPFWATKAELWAPLALGPRVDERNGGTLRVFARLAPGATLDAARAEMAAITAGLEQQYPGTNRDVQVLSLREQVVGPIRPALLLLLGAVGFVLLMACANVAHMLLARAAYRQKEIAVRLALGATRGRILRQLLTESLLFAVLGAAAGLLLATAGIRMLVALGPADLPRLDAIGIDAHVLMFVLVAAGVTAVLFGLAPALQNSTNRAGDVLKVAARGSTGDRRSARVRDLLIVSEFAAAVVLLVGAGLMTRSFVGLQAIDPGFNPHYVLTAIVSVAGSTEQAQGRTLPFYLDVVDELRTLPGVTSVSAINHLPLAGDIWGMPFALDDRPRPPADDWPASVYRAVLPEYFRTMGIPVLHGRDISSADTIDAPGVVVVNETLAARIWPGDTAVGKRLAFEDIHDTPRWLTVIGVIKDTRQSQWTGAADPEAYVPVMQTRGYIERPTTHLGYMTFVVRTTHDARALGEPLRGRIQSLDRNVVVSDVQTMDDVVAGATARPRFYLLLFGLFGIVALILAAVGIYGVMSYAVSRRTQEIGVRLSLGATRGRVMRMILGRGMVVALTGACVGVAAALAASRAMSTLLYGVRPADPATFAVVILLLGGAALVATYVPGRRATRIDPLVAWREEP